MAVQITSRKNVPLPYRKWASKTLGKTAIKALITKGKTNSLKGFKKKNGDTFEAKLKLENNKLSFDFS